MAKMRCDRCGRRPERSLVQGDRCGMVTVDTRYFEELRYVICQGTFQPEEATVTN